MKSAAIIANYKEGDFKITLKTEFDFKSKYVQNPNITVTLGSDDKGWTLGISGGADIVVPNWKTIGLTVTYLDGLFDATATVNDIKVGKYVSGTITLGATNANVNEKGEAEKTGNGKQFLLYGSGEISVTLGENINSKLGVRLSKDGKVLITGKLTVTEEKLLKDDLLKFHHTIFDIKTPKVPVFSIGIGQIFLQIEGNAEAMAKIAAPTISIDVDLKETDIFNPKAFTVGTKITPKIQAEAGLDLGVKFILGAQALVFVISANIGGTLKFHIVAGAEAELDLIWSPEKGISFKHAEGRLSNAIVVSGEITGGVSVDLDLFLTTIHVWGKQWSLAEMKFGELGQMAFRFPIDFNESGGIVTPKTDDLKPDSKYTDKNATESLLSDKAGGGPNKVDKKPEDFKKEILDFFYSLPAIGPTSPLYVQQRGRHFFVHELETNYKDENWQWLKDEWAALEMREYYKLADNLRQPRSTKTEKSAQLSQFAINHTTVPKAEISILENELKLQDLSTGQTPVQKKPIFESEGDEKENTVQKKMDGGGNSQTASVESSLNQSAGKGAALLPATKDEMESSIGSDFSDVKIHDDSNAHSLSETLGAQAFTRGSDVFFNKGKYDPETDEGKRLLAHELTHVVQQGGPDLQMQPTDPKSPNDPTVKAPVQNPDTNINIIPPDWVKEPDSNDVLAFVFGKKLVVLPASGYFVLLQPPPAGKLPSEPVFTVPTIGKEGLSVVRVNNRIGFQLDAGGKTAVVFPNGMNAIKSALNIDSIGRVVITHIHRDHVRSIVELVRTENIPPDQIYYPIAFTVNPRALGSTFARAIVAMSKDPTLSRLGYGPTGNFKIIPTPEEGNLIHETFSEGKAKFEFYGVSSAFRKLQEARLKNTTQSMADSASLLTKVTYTPTGYSAVFLGDLRGSDLTMLKEAMTEPVYNQMLSGVNVVQGFQHHMGALGEPGDSQGRKDREGLVDFLTRTQLQSGSLKVIVQTKESYAGNQFLNRSLVKALTDLGVDVHLAMEPQQTQTGTITASSGGQVTQKGFGKMESHPGSTDIQMQIGRLNNLKEAETILVRYQGLIKDGGTYANNVKEARTQLENNLRELIKETIEGVQTGNTGRAQNALSSDAQAKQSAIQQRISQRHPFEDVLMAGPNKDFLQEMSKNGEHLETFMREMKEAEKTGKLSETGIDALWEINPQLAQKLVQQSGLERMEKKRVRQSIPGAEMPFRTRAGAALMLGLEVFNLVAPFIQEYKESKTESDVRVGIRQAMWWQSKGVYPGLEAVNDRFIRSNIWSTDPAEINEMLRDGDVNEFTTTDIPEAMWDMFLLWASTNIRNYRDWQSYIVEGEKLGTIKKEGNNLQDFKWYYRKGEIKGKWIGFDITTDWKYHEKLTTILRGVGTAMVQNTEQEMKDTTSRVYDPKTDEEGQLRDESSQAKPISEIYVKSFRGKPPPLEKQIKKFNPLLGKPRLYTLAEKKEIEFDAPELLLHIFPKSALWKYYFSDDFISDEYVVVGGADYNSYMYIYRVENSIYSPSNKTGYVKPYKVNPNFTELMLAKKAHLIDA